MALPSEEYPVEVPFRPASGDVSPVVGLVNLPEVGEEVDYGDLELAGVDAVVGGYEWIAQVIYAGRGRSEATIEGG